jgi:hypothetical protein
MSEARWFGPVLLQCGLHCFFVQMLFVACVIHSLHKTTRTASSIATVVSRGAVFNLGHSAIEITSFLSIQDTDTVSVISDVANETASELVRDWRVEVRQIHVVNGTCNDSFISSRRVLDSHSPHLLQHEIQGNEIHEAFLTK